MQSQRVMKLAVAGSGPRAAMSPAAASVISTPGAKYHVFLKK